MRRIFISVFIAILVSCSSPGDTLVVGTFNIEWLGDGIDDRHPRTENIFKEIGILIQNTGADILALQEIENETALKRVLNYASNYNYIFGKNTGKQNVAVIFKKNVSIKKVEDYLPLTLNNRGLRHGLVFEADIGKQKYLFLAVHLKSTSSFDSTIELKEESRIVRYKQSEIISRWFDSVNKIHKNIVLLGDFNDNPEKESTSLTPISNNKKIYFMTSHLQSCKFKFLKTIDQIAVSENLKSKYIENSVRVFDVNKAYDDNTSKQISDHCPVLVNFRIN